MQNSLSQGDICTLCSQFKNNSSFKSPLLTWYERLNFKGHQIIINVNVQQVLFSDHYNKIQVRRIRLNKLQLKDTNHTNCFGRLGHLVSNSQYRFLRSADPIHKQPLSAKSATCLLFWDTDISMIALIGSMKSGTCLLQYATYVLSLEKNYNLRFQVLTGMNMQIIFWDVAPCNPAERYQSYGRRRCQHLQDTRINCAENRYREYRKVNGDVSRPIGDGDP